MNKIVWTLLCMSGLFFFGCGSSKETFTFNDPELEALFQGTDYKSLTDAARYNIGMYYLNHDDSSNGRAVLEDIITYNPHIPAIKFHLAKIYLSMESVTFNVKNEEGDAGQIVRNGREIGEAVLREIIQNDPGYFPAYTELMMLAVDNEDTTAFSSLYNRASEGEKSYLGSDYRIGYLTLLDKENENRFEEAKKYFASARKTYAELYDSYKNLGDIQRVQFQDTLAYKSYKKAIEYQSEAHDLFLVYYHLAEVCMKIYADRNDERYRAEALEYACRSLTRFPGYAPSLSIIRSNAGVQSRADSAKAPVEYAVSFHNYCEGQFGGMKIPSMAESASVIPRSIFRETVKDLRRK